MASWTPIENTYYHFLTFDLGDKRIISSISTLGRSHTNEFVTEYIIQYSDDGELWRSYVSPGGEVQVNQKSLVFVGKLFLFSICCCCFCFLNNYIVKIGVFPLF